MDKSRVARQSYSEKTETHESDGFSGNLGARGGELLINAPTASKVFIFQVNYLTW